jgi:hypothetical protein
MTGVLRDLFGPGTWGTGGNLVAWILCGVLAGLWLRARMKAHHLAQLALAARHHRDKTTQAQSHHEQLLGQAAEYQQQLLDQAHSHHQALKAHVAAVAGAAAAGTAAAERVVPAATLTAMPLDEFERQLRVLVRADPGEWGRRVAEIVRRHNGRFP